jgi:uncharacterized protein YsxB (DUF464 family)
MDLVQKILKSSFVFYLHEITSKPRPGIEPGKNGSAVHCVSLSAILANAVFTIVSEQTANVTIDIKYYIMWQKVPQTKTGNWHLLKDSMTLILFLLMFFQ